MSSATTMERATVDASNQNDKPTKIVGYIRDMLQELAELTPAEAGHMLPYLIDMARLEATEAEERLATLTRQ